MSSGQFQVPSLERAKQFYIHATESNVQACLICRYDALVNDHVNRLVSNYSTYSAIYDLNDQKTMFRANDKKRYIKKKVTKRGTLHFAKRGVLQTLHSRQLYMVVGINPAAPYEACASIVNRTFFLVCAPSLRPNCPTTRVSTKKAR